MGFLHLAYIFIAQARQIGSRHVFCGVKVLGFDIASLFRGRATRLVAFNYGSKNFPEVLLAFREWNLECCVWD